MKGIKRITAIGLCILFLILSVPVMGLAGYNDPDSVFGNLFSFVSTVADTGYSVDRDGNNSYLYFDGEKVTDIGMHFDGTDYYYVLTDSTLACGEKIYAYNNNGLLDKAYYYFEDDCKMRKDGWLDLDDGILHYEDGKISQGLTKVDNDYYFFELNRGYLLKNQDIFVNDENRYRVKPGTYTFDAEGKMTVTPEILPDYGKDATATGIVMHSCFSDNMILQRDQLLTIWGKADANSGTVVVEFAGETAKAEVNAEGSWKATFDKPFRASDAKRKLKIHGGDKDVVLKDVLVGDVYYVIGQSNVHYSLQEQTNEMLAHGLNVYWDYNDSRNIRFYRNSALYTANLTGPFAQGTALEFTEIMVPYGWMTPSEVESYIPTAINQNANHRAFSALGYLFAYGLSDKTDIPVGIIEIDAAGMPLISFAPNSLAAKWGDEVFDPATDIYTYSLRNGFLAQPAMISRFVYNQLINPMKDFAIAGLVWYQGESDFFNHRSLFGDDGRTYAYQFAELMEFYRNTLGGGQYDFPVYMIELPPSFSNKGLNAHIDFGNTRCEQGRIGELMSDFHLVSSADFYIDISYANALHPYIKDKQAARLAKVVAADRYGIGSTETEMGPQLASLTYTSDTSVTVTYTNVGTGLKTFNNGILYGFEVCIGFEAGTSAIWERADSAQITDTNTVAVSHDKQIYGIRYHGQTEAFYPGFLLNELETFNVTLTNSNGIPASAFVDIKD